MIACRIISEHLFLEHVALIFFLWAIWILCCMCLGSSEFSGGLFLYFWFEKTGRSHVTGLHCKHCNVLIKSFPSCERKKKNSTADAQAKFIESMRKRERMLCWGWDHMSRTASVLIQGKVKCFIASMKAITVLGAMRHQANTSWITFSLAICLC